MTEVMRVYSLTFDPDTELEELREQGSLTGLWALDGPDANFYPYRDNKPLSDGPMDDLQFIKLLFNLGCEVEFEAPYDGRFRRTVKDIKQLVKDLEL